MSLSRKRLEEIRELAEEAVTRGPWRLDEQGPPDYADVVAPDDPDPLGLPRPVARAQVVRDARLIAALDPQTVGELVEDAHYGATLEAALHDLADRVRAMGLAELAASLDLLPDSARRDVHGCAGCERCA